MVLVLFETPAGYAVFKVTNKGLLDDADAIAAEFTTPTKAQSAVKLKAFSKFVDTRAALEAATAVCDGALDSNLQTFLSELLAREKDGKMKLAVADSKLAALIKDKVSGIKCIYDATVAELMRGIRSQLNSLLTGLSADDTRTMQLGLAHSLCRYKLKFSPDKVDVMIIQAISLLDELDKELNTYAMRVREWYGWHFPEMGKIVTDNLQYARCVQAMKIRTAAQKTDFSNILTEEVETQLKEASQVSMGTEIAEEDVTNILALCTQVLKIAEYRTSLYEYLRNRMSAIAPNLTVMVGELVGARLIAHAGSLLSLAKAPASTVQILGAEKALFRALKTKHDTPKYGLIYHASLVGQAAPKLKGKVSRMLAAKTALACRADALGDETTPSIAFENKAKVESRLRQLEGGKASSIKGAGAAAATPKKSNTPAQQKYTPKSESKSYSADGDAAVNLSVKSSPSSSSSSSSSSSETEEERAARKAAKKEAKRKAKEADGGDADADGEEKKKKKEKRKRDEDGASTETEGEQSAKKEKKKKKTSDE